jgi:hypothetical protein
MRLSLVGPAFVLALAPRADAHVPLDPGDVTITEIHAGPIESGGQWFEVRNNDSTDGNNLIEQRFFDADGHMFEVTGAVIVYEGEYAVFALDSSPVKADYRFPSSFHLPPDGGAITLDDHLSGPVDVVTWDAGWSLGEGAVALNPGQAANAWANDRLVNWCQADATAGAENPWCPGSETDDDGDGQSEQEGDCDDGDPRAFHGAVEIECDGVDEDCDGNETCTVGVVDDTDARESANGVFGEAAGGSAGSCAVIATPRALGWVVVLSLAMRRRRA